MLLVELKLFTRCVNASWYSRGRGQGFVRVTIVGPPVGAVGKEEARKRDGGKTIVSGRPTRHRFSFGLSPLVAMWSSSVA